MKDWFHRPWLRSLRHLFPRRRPYPTKATGRRRPSLEALEERCVPAAITEFPGLTANAQATGIVAAADGNFWFTEFNTDRIGRITTTGVVTEFTLKAGSGPLDIASDPTNGLLYFTEKNAGQIGAINPLAGSNAAIQSSVTESPVVPSGAGAGLDGITVGPDGNLWFTEVSVDRIGRATPNLITVTEFSAGITAGAAPANIVAGPDGALWFTESGFNGNAGAIGRITTAGTVTNEFALSGNNNSPQDLAFGPDNALWFTNAGSDQIGRIDLAAHITTFQLPVGSDPQGIASGPFGALYFAEAGRNLIGQITTTGSLQEFGAGMITAGSQPTDVAVGGANIWFTEANNTAVGRLLPDAPVPPPASGTSIPPSVSVAFSPFGQVTELVTSAGVLVQFDALGGHVLGGGVRAASVAFFGGSEVVLVTFQTGALVQYDAAGAHLLGSGGVQDASVAFGPFGEVIDVVSTAGVLTQFDAFGAHTLGGGVAFISVAFFGGTEVQLVTTQAGALVQFDAAGAHVFFGGVRSAGVAFGPAGEVLDVIFSDESLSQFDAFGAHLLGNLSVPAPPPPAPQTPQTPPALEVAGTNKITGLYVFRSPANANNTVLIFNFQAFPGVLTPNFADPSQTYDINIDNSSPLDAIQDLTFRVTYGAPDGNGVQSVILRELPTGKSPPDGIIATGLTGQNIPIFGGTGMFRTAIQDEPFFFDQGGFSNAVAAGDLTKFPRPVGQANDFFGPNVNTFSIILEVPSTRLTPVANGILGVWAAINDQNGVQVDRMGRPLIDEALIPPVPRNNLTRGERRIAFDDGLPSHDRANFKADMVSVLTNPNFYFKESAATADAISNFLLPDVLPFQIGNPNGYGTFIGPGGQYLGNGRRLTDPVVHTTFAVLTGGAITTDNVNDDNGFRITDGTIEPVTGKPRAIAFPYIGSPFEPLNGPGTAPNP